MQELNRACLHLSQAATEIRVKQGNKPEKRKMWDSGQEAPIEERNSQDNGTQTATGFNWSRVRESDRDMTTQRKKKLK